MFMVPGFFKSNETDPAFFKKKIISLVAGLHFCFIYFFLLTKKNMGWNFSDYPLTNT
jgi:hypothetical protein